MKRAICFEVVVICILSLLACGKTDSIPRIQETENNISEDQQSDDSGSESANGFFFPQGAESCVYMASFADWPQQKEKEVVLHITEVQVFEEGTLYELKMDSDVEAPDTHAGYRGDWRNFGLFYVQGDEIYFIRAEEAESKYQTVEEILNIGTLVCNEAGEEDVLGEDERGWHEFISVDGNRREYHGYSTLVETGYYEHFYWEKGKGLVTYESGYGAEADGINLHLLEEAENVTTENVKTENIKTENIEIGDEAQNDTYEMQDWQIVYTEYVESIKYPQYNEYALIYVDEDDIPELVIYTGTFADACTVLTFHNGEMSVLQTWSLQCNYIEKENLYWDGGGHMGEFYDHVYTIEDGKWVHVAGGEYIAKDLLTEEYDYVWNGEAVSEDEYYEGLHAVYDIDKNQNAAYEKQFEGLDEMLFRLQSGK